MNMEADVGEAEAVESPPTKNSDSWIWIVIPIRPLRFLKGR